MTPAQHERVDALFNDLFDLSPEDRAVELAAEADPEVRAEAASLLEHVGLPTNAIRNPIGDLIADAGAAGAFDDRTVGPGTRFERYRIERKLGQGGMGDVYEAVRENDFHKRVALKIVRYGLDSDFARARFQQERQTLAGLEHPYIARLLDGGEAANGCPYLVLEFVDGVSIDVYTQTCTRDETLTLFLKVCEAVEYAHRNLVIHRDLKPGNILVTVEGEPKLLDFGIAKLLSPGNEVTQTLAAAMTPQYASPEQVLGRPITTASDVYSLGAILYQLLTGRKPYQLDSNTALELERTICLTPPAPPALGNELDHILLMALRKEPERRYQSVLEFSQDLRRFSAGHPVHAAPDTALYRARKYVSRHWVGLAATAAAMLALIVGAGVSTYQAHVAQQRLQQVRELANIFLFQIHDQIVDIAGTTKARAFVVETAQAYLGKVAKSAGSDPAIQAELAQAYRRIGDAQGQPRRPNLGDRVGAESSYRHSVDLYTPLLKKHPEYRADAMESWTSLAFLYQDMHRLTDSRKAQDRAMVLASSLEGDRSDHSLFALYLTYQVGAELEISFGNKKLYIEDDLRSLHFLQTWAKSQSGANSGDIHLPLATAHWRLGRAYLASSEFLAAEGQLKESIEEGKLALSLDAQNARSRAVLISATSSLAALYGSNILPSMERYTDAVVRFREVVELTKPLYEADPSNTTVRANYTRDLLDLAYDLSRVHKGDGLPQVRQALAVWEQRPHGENASARDSTVALDDMRKGVTILSEHGFHAEARTLSARILSGHRKLLDGTPPTSDELYYIVGDLQTAAEAAERAGDQAAADNMLQEGLDVAAPFLPVADQLLPTAFTAANYFEALRLERAATGRCPEAHMWQSKEIWVWTHLSQTNPYAAMRLSRIQSAPLPCAGKV